MVGVIFSYVAYGIFSLWLLGKLLSTTGSAAGNASSVQTAAYMGLCCSILVFNTFCYYYKEEDRSFAKMFGPTFDYLIHMRAQQAWI